MFPQVQETRSLQQILSSGGTMRGLNGQIVLLALACVSCWFTYSVGASLRLFPQQYGTGNRDQHQQRNSPVVNEEGLVSASETFLRPSVQIIEHRHDNELSMLVGSANSTGAMPPMTTPSFLQSEVEQITHIPHESKIVVKFKDSIDRKCLKPRIFGRISGQYLSMIHWDADAEGKLIVHDELNHRRLIFDNTTRTDIITGYYILPSTGRYSIEIIGLLCNDFPFDQDFNPICLEDADHNHLTAPDAFIDVMTTSDALLTDAAASTKPLVSTFPPTARKPFGFWKWNNATIDPVPLTTRYQGQNCRKSVEKRCLESGSLERFKPYSFQWSDPDMSTLSYHDNDKIKADSNQTLHICAAGNSHSRELVVHFNYWIDRFNITNVSTGQLTMSYPRDMKYRFGKKAVNCNITIVGLGQWSAGKKPRKVIPATTLPEYYKELQNGILNWKSLGVKMALRKIHYNPLGDISTQCPPIDWRSPPVIDGYNEIVQTLAEKHNIPYIDAGAVMDPMWDSASDYCHYRGLEGRTEALYILQEVFRMKKNNIQGWQGS